MGAVSDYGYINAKLKARIGILEESDIIEDLVKAPSLMDVFSILSEKGYQRLSEVYEKSGDLEEVELEIFKSEIEAYNEVGKLLPKKAHFFIEILEEKLELENLKSAIRVWYSTSVKHHEIRNRAIYLYKERIVSDIDIEGIVNSITYDGIVKSVENSPYYEIIRLYTFSDIEKDGLFRLEIELDKLYFERLFKAVEKLSLDDRRLVEDIYNKDMDLKNILLLVRYGYYHRLERSSLKNIVFPYGTIYKYLNANGYFEKGDIIVGIREAVHRRYSRILGDIEEISQISVDSKDDKTRMSREILRLESYLSEVRDKEYKSLSSKDPFSIGIILSYFYLRNHIDQRIRALLSLKRYSFSEEQIREALR